MSTTTMLTGNALAVKNWERKVWLQAMQKTVFAHLFNRGAVYCPPKLMGPSSTGDAITFPYVGKLTGIPIGEGGTVDGNEEALSLNSHSMVINVSRIPVLNPNTDTIEQQRTTVEFESTSKDLVAKRCAELLDTACLYHLAGADPTSFTINGTTYASAANKLQAQGHNAPTAPTSGRIIRANAAATDQALTSSDTLTLDMVDYALELNSRSDQPMELLEDETFDLFVSPEQLVDLQQNATGKIQWFNIQLAKITGGYKDNELENRFKNNMVCAGRYRNVYIYEAPRTAYGLRSDTSAVITTVRRAVMVGGDALSYGSPFGGRPTDKSVPVKYFSMLKDYEYYKGIEARMLYGVKKMSPANKEDIGVTVLSTYAASHS